jgi:hypothetical protein
VLAAAKRNSFWGLPIRRTPYKSNDPTVACGTRSPRVRLNLRGFGEVAILSLRLPVGKRQGSRNRALRKALAIQRDLLAALIGRPPSEEPPETFRLADLHLPVDLPLSVPSQLIEQRPDVRSEEQLHSASAQVGVAVANMLPHFTISGNCGYTVLDFASLFSSANLFWTVAGNATQTVFDGFTLPHNKRAAEAAYDQAAWNYRTTVIIALRNVVDALRAIQDDAGTLQAARANERAWKLSFELTSQRYRSGAVNIVVLLDAQQSQQTAVIALVQAQAARLAVTAALYRALGGGWWNRPQPLKEKKATSRRTQRCQWIGRSAATCLRFRASSSEDSMRALARSRPGIEITLVGTTSRLLKMCPCGFFAV